MCTVADLLDLRHTLAGGFLGGFGYPWEALAEIGGFIESLSRTLPRDYQTIGDCVWAHKSAKIAPTAFLGKWTVIGAETEVRHCAFIRGKALVGDNCVVGNSAELKNAILFDGAQTPHFNYVGDSILGYKAHMGAGAITSNVKADKGTVCVRGGKLICTGLKKFGAIVGDFAEIGCNAVLNPGTVVGRRSTVYPSASVRGTVPADCIVKCGKPEIVRKKPSEGGGG